MAMTTLIANRPSFLTGMQRGPVAISDVAAHKLPPDGVLRFERPLGQTVHCLEGSLWITLDGDCRDVVMEAGAKHRCDRNTTLTVQALGKSAKLCLEEAAPPTPEPFS
jgi:hypothetical protein